MQSLSEVSYQPEEEESAHCGSWWSFFTFVFFLLAVFFTILVIYSLVAYNTASVQNFCPDLYPYVLTRTILGLCLFLATTLFQYCCAPSSSTPPKTFVYGLLVFYFLSLGIYGAIVVSKNMLNNPSCVSTLYDTTFQVPLLGDLGWVYVICDWVYVLGVLLVAYNAFISPDTAVASD